MDENRARFMYLKNNFPRIRDAKITEWIFLGPQILTEYVYFENQLREVERAAQK